MLSSPLASLTEDLETQGEKCNRISGGNWEQMGLGKERRCQASCVFFPLPSDPWQHSTAA